MSTLDPFVALLTHGTPPRTWSVIVTIFGDLAQGPDDEIGSPLLARMGDTIGLRPEAVRTALHRLHKEGWLERRRDGRHSLYRLSARGRTESEAAGPRIYGTAPAAQAFVLLGPTEMGTQVAPSMRVAPAPAPDPEVLSYPLETAPDWMRAALLPPETTSLIHATEARLTALAQVLAEAPPSDPHLRAVLRVLCVHAWRRIALRLPDLPDSLLPAGAELGRTRAAFASLCAALPTPPLTDL